MSVSNNVTREGLIKKTNNPRFVYDSQRRLIQMYSDVVMEKAAGLKLKKAWASVSSSNANCKK